MPDEAAAESLATPLRIVDADRAHTMPACDAASGDELGLPGSKTTHATVPVHAVEGAALDPTPVATVFSPSAGSTRRISRDVPVSRAPPLV
ncbi:MAG: hypothetical protein HY615_09465 [Candidatus Rokubacteria bacterium]|nr:hypothetical protein [Candidatus Rokubacteria bacterium]